MPTRITKYAVQYTNYTTVEWLEICTSIYFDTLKEAQTRLDKEDWRNDNPDFTRYWAKIISNEFEVETQEEMMFRKKAFFGKHN